MHYTLRLISTVLDMKTIPFYLLVWAIENLDNWCPDIGVRILVSGCSKSSRPGERCACPWHTSCMEECITTIGECFDYIYFTDRFHERTKPTNNCLKNPNNFDVTILKYECEHLVLGILRKFIEDYLRIVFCSFHWSVSGSLVLSKF